MKHMVIRRPHFHWPTHDQMKWLYAALIAVAAIGGLLALGWYAGAGDFGEWSLFAE